MTQPAAPPQYGVAGYLGSTPNAVQLTQGYFLGLYDLLFPLEYLFPMKTTANGGYEVFKAFGKVGERSSLAVQRLEVGQVILFAPLGARATGTVAFSRPTFAAGAVTIKAGTLVSTSRGGRKFSADSDLSFGATDLGPKTATVTAVAPGYEYDVLGTVATAGGEIVPGDIDTVWMLFEDPPFGDPTFVVTNAAPTSGGLASELEGLGYDRGILLQSGETAARYRVRVRSLPDTVSPGAIRRTLTNLLGQSHFCFREVGQPLLRGAFMDGDVVPGSDPSLSDFYDTDCIVLTGPLFLGPPAFAFQEPVEVRDSSGHVLAQGWLGIKASSGFTSTFTIIRRGSNNITPGALSGVTVNGLRTGASWVATGCTDVSAVVNARRFRVYLDYLEMRGFFLVGLPPSGVGDFGIAYDTFPDNAYDGIAPYENFMDGYAVTAANQALTVWHAIDAVRAGGVSFGLYVERIGCT